MLNLYLSYCQFVSSTANSGIRLSLVNQLNTANTNLLNYKTQLLTTQSKYIKNRIYIFIIPIVALAALILGTISKRMIPLSVALVLMSTILFFLAFKDDQSSHDTNQMLYIKTLEYLNQIATAISQELTTSPSSLTTNTSMSHIQSTQIKSSLISSATNLSATVSNAADTNFNNLNAQFNKMGISLIDLQNAQSVLKSMANEINVTNNNKTLLELLSTFSSLCQNYTHCVSSMNLGQLSLQDQNILFQQLDLLNKDYSALATQLTQIKNSPNKTVATILAQWQSFLPNNKLSIDNIFAINQVINTMISKLKTVTTDCDTQLEIIFDKYQDQQSLESFDKLNQLQQVLYLNQIQSTIGQLKSQVRIEDTSALQDYIATLKDHTFLDQIQSLSDQLNNIIDGTNKTNIINQIQNIRSFLDFLTLYGYDQTSNVSIQTFIHTYVSADHSAEQVAQITNLLFKIMSIVIPDVNNVDTIIQNLNTAGFKTVNDLTIFLENYVTSLQKYQAVQKELSTGLYVNSFNDINDELQSINLIFKNQNLTLDTIDQYMLLIQQKLTQSQMLFSQLKDYMNSIQVNTTMEGFNQLITNMQLVAKNLDLNILNLSAFDKMFNSYQSNLSTLQKCQTILSGLDSQDWNKEQISGLMTQLYNLAQTYDKSALNNSTKLNVLMNNLYSLTKYQLFITTIQNNILKKPASYAEIRDYVSDMIKALTQFKLSLTGSNISTTPLIDLYKQNQDLQQILNRIMPVLQKINIQNLDQAIDFMTEISQLSLPANTDVAVYLSSIGNISVEQINQILQTASSISTDITLQDLTAFYNQCIQITGTNINQYFNDINDIISKLNTMNNILQTNSIMPLATLIDISSKIQAISNKTIENSFYIYQDQDLKSQTDTLNSMVTVLQNLKFSVNNYDEAIKQLQVVIGRLNTYQLDIYNGDFLNQLKAFLIPINNEQMNFWNAYFNTSQSAQQILNTIQQYVSYKQAYNITTTLQDANSALNTQFQNLITSLSNLKMGAMLVNNQDLYTNIQQTCANFNTFSDQINQLISLLNPAVSQYNDLLLALNNLNKIQDMLKTQINNITYTDFLNTTDLASQLNTLQKLMSVNFDELSSLVTDIQKLLTSSTLTSQEGHVIELQTINTIDSVLEFINNQPSNSFVENIYAQVEQNIGLFIPNNLNMNLLSGNATYAFACFFSGLYNDISNLIYQHYLLSGITSQYKTSNHRYDITQYSFYSIMQILLDIQAQKAKKIFKMNSIGSNNAYSLFTIYQIDNKVSNYINNISQAILTHSENQIPVTVNEKQQLLFSAPEITAITNFNCPCEHFDLINTNKTNVKSSNYKKKSDAMSTITQELQSYPKIIDLSAGLINNNLPIQMANFNSKASAINFTLDPDTSKQIFESISKSLNNVCTLVRVTDKDLNIISTYYPITKVMCNYIKVQNDFVYNTPSGVVTIKDAQSSPKLLPNGNILIQYNGNNIQLSMLSASISISNGNLIITQGTKQATFQLQDMKITQTVNGDLYVSLRIGTQIVVKKYSSVGLYTNFMVIFNNFKDINVNYNETISAIIDNVQFIKTILNAKDGDNISINTNNKNNELILKDNNNIITNIPITTDSNITLH